MEMNQGEQVVRLGLVDHILLRIHSKGVAQLPVGLWLQDENRKGGRKGIGGEEGKKLLGILLVEAVL